MGCIVWALNTTCRARNVPGIPYLPSVRCPLWRHTRGAAWTYKPTKSPIPYKTTESHILRKSTN